MRHSGLAGKALVAECGETVYYRLAVARAVASGMQPKGVCWTVSWTSRTNWQHSHRDRRWSRESCRVSKMSEESRWNVDSCNAVRGLPWDVTEREGEAAEAV